MAHACTIQAHFRLAFDELSDVHLLEMLAAQGPLWQVAMFYFVVES